MKGNWTGPILNRLFFWACQFLYFSRKICLCICVTWWIISFFRVLHEARFDASQTPLETPSLFTAAAFSSRFLPSDRNITRLLLLVSCDMTSVERTFSCQTVKRLKAHSPLTFSWSIVNTKKACCLSDSLSRASDLSGQKDSRILSRSSSERLTFHSGVQSGEEAGLFSWASVWVGAHCLSFLPAFYLFLKYKVYQQHVLLRHWAQP